MDLWEDANTGFGNGTDRQGRYLFNVVNSGPWPDMSVGIGYGAEWSVGYNGSSSDVPTALEGPSFVAVSDGVIELKLPLDMIGTPSMYYGPPTGNYATSDEAGVGEKSYIPDFRDIL